MKFIFLTISLSCITTDATENTMKTSELIMGARTGPVQVTGMRNSISHVKATGASPVLISNLCNKIYPTPRMKKGKNKISAGDFFPQALLWK